MITFLALFENNDYDRIEVKFKASGFGNSDYEKRLHEIENEYWGWYLINVIEVVENNVDIW